MHTYEGMFILRPDLTEDTRKEVFSQISDTISKNGGSQIDGQVWSEKRRLHFPINKQNEGIYYLVHFTLPTDAITKVKYAYKLNEKILRVLILVG